MMLWRSVVGKLWFTILLLVSVILIILTIMLLQFFENYHIEQAEQGMKKNAHKISEIIKEHKNLSSGLSISWELIDDVTRVIVMTDESHAYHSPNSLGKRLEPEYLLKEEDFVQVFDEQKEISRVITSPTPSSNKDSSIIVIGVPLKLSNNEQGAVFVYQSLEVLQETTTSTTKFIVLVAGVAIILTTIFAFFLSTRITLPLRKMREAAFQVARGKFDTKLPVLTHDEIGELATAFNQMGRQLKYNISALSQEKEQLSSILSSMADGVITFNRDGTILITNPPADQFLQYWYFDKGESSSNREAVPSEVMKLFELAVSTEKEQIGEISHHGRYWTLIVSPLYNNTFIRGAVAVLRDMTEERKLDKLRKDFIANVSHELRTPIAMLQGYSEAIVDDIAGTEEEKKEIAKVIYDESLRMGRLVNELLDLARMEAGHIQLNIDEIELSPYLNRIIRKFQGLAKDKNIDLNSSLQLVDKEQFKLDPDRIEQVLTNLIDNAIRHTPENGTVMLNQKIDKNGLYIDIQDTGAGIPEDDLPFVFERFYKADKARTRGKSGTGLGLAIVKNIIEAHKGHVTVHSTLGQGTTFSFFIPRNSE